MPQEIRPLQGSKSWQYLGLQSCVKSVLLELLQQIWYQSYWGISHWLGSELGSDSNPSLSRATSVNILQLGSEIPSLHWKSELNLVHTEGSAQAGLRLSSGFSELSPEPSQCEMPHFLNSTGNPWLNNVQNPKEVYFLMTRVKSACHNCTKHANWVAINQFNLLRDLCQRRR